MNGGSICLCLFRCAGEKLQQSVFELLNVCFLMSSVFIHLLRMQCWRYTLSCCCKQNGLTVPCLFIWLSVIFFLWGNKNWNVRRLTLFLKKMLAFISRNRNFMKVELPKKMLAFISRNRNFMKIDLLFWNEQHCKQALLHVFDM